MASANDSEVRDLNYFDGGYWPWGHGSTHNRYAADESGFGRDDKNIPGSIAGSFHVARNLALQQSIEFLRWVENSMVPEMRRRIFGTIAIPLHDDLFIA